MTAKSFSEEELKWHFKVVQDHFLDVQLCFSFLCMSAALLSEWTNEVECRR